MAMRPTASEAIRRLSIAERHLAHYQQCGCLDDTDICCVVNCPCKEER